MKRAVPPAHACADCFLLDVLGEGRTLLGELRVKWRGQVAHWIQSALIDLEEHLLGILAEESSQSAVHGLLLSATQVTAEDRVALLDELAVDVGSMGRAVQRGRAFGCGLLEYIFSL